MAWRFPVWWFLVLFLVNSSVVLSVCFLSDLLRALLIPLSCCLSSRPFRFVLFIFFAIFQSKIVRFLLHTVVGMISCHLLPVVDRIFLRCFRIFIFLFLWMFLTLQDKGCLPSSVSTVWILFPNKEKVGRFSHNCYVFNIAEEIYYGKNNTFAEYSEYSREFIFIDNK